MKGPAREKRSGEQADLFGLAVSPWSITARWAMDYHQQPYRWHDYVTLLTPLLLRRRLKRPAGQITAPVLLLADGRALVNSSGIVRYADAVGSGPQLRPAGFATEIDRWCDVADALAKAGRALMMSRLCSDREAQLAALPPFLPLPIRKRLRFMGPMTAKSMSRKYGFSLDDDGAAREAMAGALRTIDAAVQVDADDRERPTTLLPMFSLADIAIAASLQLLSPTTHDSVPIPPATRVIWTQAALAEEFRHLLAWRDSIFDRYRYRRGTDAADTSPLFRPRANLIGGQ